MPEIVDTSPEPHVAALAFPFGTHAAPLLAVIRRLAAAAPAAHFSFFGTARSNASIFSASESDAQRNVTAHDVPDGIPENYVFSGRPLEHIDLFMAAAPEVFRAGVAAAAAEAGRKVSCVVSDAFFWFAAEIAEEMGVPWVPFWTAGPASLSAHVHTDAFRQRINEVGGFVGHEDEPLEIIPGMSRLRYRDLPEGVVFGNLESSFSEMLHKMGLMLPHGAALFMNSFEELDTDMTNYLKSKFKKFLNVGPSNLITPQPPPSNKVPDASGCIPWLDKQNPASVAYVSFGTVMTPTPNEITALVEALEESGVTFLWSFRNNSEAHLPNEFLENTKGRGMVLPWAPQKEVLAHDAVGVFVTHCGWNSLLESIAGAVPMICRPFFGDQRLNAQMIHRVWEIGVEEVGGVLTKNGLMKSLTVVLSQEEGRKMRVKIKNLKELAQKAVEPEGSSTQNFKALLETILNKRDA
ncbi:anthocyanidin 3-O-glucosyltransferase UFGT-like [Malania oleifera]|uniref:anthocyanidin 3-O-glucosyltransferase UFGT-like n=1 Tax=Malania oleifera TaxID=397392 RepID=UPI0025AE7225|nr:anthocyanidin 3-O-glucosyltransferase UFGT-like [Malania oleifera]